LPSHNGQFSVEEQVALDDLRLQTVAEEPEFQPISSQAQQRKLQHDLEVAARSPEKGSEYAGVAASQPPLYYALQAIPYTLGRSGTLLDRIELMRLFSALFAGITAMFTFLFVRETLPSVRWAWTVGGLGVALVPLLGFMSGAVNPDSMLYAVTAVTFYTLARGFRRGLTRKTALALGALIAVGFATKLNFVGIAPGALLGFLVLGIRAARLHGRAVYASLAMALAIALSPVLIYVVGHVASGAPALGIVSNTAGVTHGSPSAELSYVWQLYLPRLPWMHNDFAGVFTSRQIWFNWFVGLYGWLDTTFPAWVYDAALLPAGAVFLLCLRELLAGAAVLRGRLVELAVYCVICIGLMALIGGDSYVRYPAVDSEYGQVRYLLPLLPLLGLVLALAARGAGKRWGPLAGAVILMLLMAQDVFSQLQVIARFYG
jgi:4-amino-4-deoxy-L-arabinose transferase-like glycosyltransferase